MEGDQYALADDLFRFGVAASRAVVQTMKDAAISLRNDLADNTPVRSGRAAASWNMNVNSPDPSFKQDGYMNPSGARRDGSVNVNDATLGDSIHVSNSIDYIESLNYGDSKHKGHGFVELAEAKLELDLPAIAKAAMVKVGL